MVSTSGLVRDGVSGLLEDVDIEIGAGGRKFIVLTIIAADDKTLKIKNNWDKCKPEHDGKFSERLSEAENLKGKRVRTKVWKNYCPEKWFCEVEKY